MNKQDSSDSILFNNGKIWQENGYFLSSFGITDGVFSYKGTGSEDTLKRNFERIIDLKNHLVLPAFTDGHVHLVYGSLIRKKIDCTDVNSPEELKKIISDYAEKNPNTKWLQGGNLNIGKLFPDTDNLLHNILDDIYSDKPVFITNYDYHSGICNSLAMEQSGILQRRDSFKADEIPVNRTGDPSGIVKEDALDYVFAKIPKSTLDEKISAVEEMTGIMHSYGITGVSDITRKEDMDVYIKLYETGKLQLRISSYLPFNEIDNLEKYSEYTKQIDPELFSIKGFKAFYDGALGSETALFKENYKGKSSNGYRTEMAESGQIYELARKINLKHKQIMIHAIGDKAVSDVLDICERLEKENGQVDRRFRIEHAQHIDEADFDRFKKLGTIVSVQPLHMKYDAKIAIEKLSYREVKRTHNYKHLLDRGVILNFGTDFPIVEINPFATIQSAVTRNIGERIFYKENSIDLHNCIKAYTINNAFASFNENKRGSITEGITADFVIMEDDLFEMQPDELSKAKILKTYMKGEEVYSSRDI